MFMYLLHLKGAPVFKRWPLVNNWQGNKMELTQTGTNSDPEDTFTFTGSKSICC